jgi:protein-disulfide isomerase
MTTQATNLRPRLTLPVGERDHIQGPATAAVVLVEYGDYQCPYCGQAYPILIDLQEQVGDRMRLVFRNFPLSTQHPHAQHAAEAAEAAGAQGKFWEMHDTLYENQGHLDDAALLRYAVEIGLDVERFNRELKDHTFAVRVNEDFQSGIRSGVNGTPTFFINGVRHDEAWDLETLTSAVLAELNSVRLVAAG